MEQSLLNIGFGGTVVAERIIAIVSPNSSPMKRLKIEAKEDKRLVDATHGRRTRSVIILDSNHVILSAIQPETISQRFEMLKVTEKQTPKEVSTLNSLGLEVETGEDESEEDE
ncbi:MAG: DUF370 domain-containing protein [Desulfobacteraceae bacterium]|nr:DUF370 domain-containing protein [Desulfobacteraceae bacterium]